MRRVVAFAMLIFFFAPFAAHADSPTLHTVAWGETLSSIARTYGVTPQAIASTNRLRLDSWVYAGTQLRIPNGSNAPASVPSTTPSGYYTVRAGDTLFSIAARFGTTVAAISTANNLPSNGVLYVGWSLKIPSSRSKSAPSTPSTSYIVQPGEYLALIAFRFNTTARAIAYANNLPNDWLIYPGQRLNIPGASAPQTASNSTTSSLNLRLTNVPLLQQKQTLTCEQAAAAMASRGALNENQLLAVMPRSENPFNGIRGKTNSPYYGGLVDYGIYAHGLQKGLNALGAKSQVYYGQSYDDFRDAIIDNLRAGRPVIWWNTWQDSYQKPVMVKLSDGTVVKLVPYEHAGVIVGADDNGVTYHDPYDAKVRFVSWQNFRRVSAYFDNMALVIQ